MNPPPLPVSQRSLRSVQKLLGEHTLFLDQGGLALSTQDNAFIISLTYLSGWTAHRIRAKVYEITGNYFSTEGIWLVHVDWVADRGLTRQQPDIRDDEVDVMFWVLKEVGDVQLLGKDRPLFFTPKPVSQTPR